jgi:hypothetical protein
MKNQNSMNKSSMRGISISILVLFSISLILIPSESYAEEINVESNGLDETAIITVTNNSEKEINTFRVWLGGELNFKSFKTEKGWTGEKNEQGVIIFTSSETIKPNELVKFGIKADKVNPVINWKALDQENKIIDTGVIKLNKLTEVNQNPDIELDQNYKNEGTSIFTESTFRIIPDKPNSGSTIRVLGDQFAASQKFEFYIDTKRIGDFITDENGHFITTMKIPNVEKDSRLDFKIIGHDQTEKKMSIRLGENENRSPELKNIKLEIKGLPNTVYPGDILKLEGTGIPGNTIIVEITNPEKIIINTRTAEVNNVGNWKILEPINIPFDAVFGKYSITASDGRNHVLKNWNVETNKTIIINPEKLKFDPGELIKFTGTASPNIPLELILEDSLGDEMISDILEIDSSGVVEFEYQTIENDDKEGTWTLIATQKNIKEFIYVGYDEIPTVPVNLKFDKKTYQNTDTAIISVIGKPSDKITLLIITPAGNTQDTDRIIQLREDGRGEFNLDLSEYTSGIYTAVAKKSGSQSSERFAVGLQVGSGPINAKITQMEYQQGERILLLGNTNPNTLMTVTLVNPSGIKIKTLEMPSNNIGAFTEERLRIPSNGEPGLWTINVASGTNLDTVKFNVFSTMLEGMSVKVVDEIRQGELLKISVIASHKTSIMIEIKDSEEQKISDLGCNTTKEFFCETFWFIPKDTTPGTYMIKVYDAISSDETTFEIIMK